MKRLWLTAVFFAGLISVSALAGEYYRLDGVSRVDQDLYKTVDGVYIETRYCYYYAYYEDAILKWEGEYSYDNKVIWEDDSTCEVEKIFRK